MFALVATEATGQSTSSPVDSVHPSVAADLALSSLAGESVVHFGIAAELTKGPFSVGAAGRRTLSSVTVTQGGALGSDVRLGYGGLRLSYHCQIDETHTVRAALLVAAGTVEQRNSFGTLLGKQNVPIAEPQVSYGWMPVPAFTVEGALSYRWTRGVDDLVGLSGSDIRSLVVSAGLRLTR